MFPLVTIAIPTYNRADSYLPQALRCALRQTYPNLEIIVSDNASTDRTQTLVTRIDDPRVRYFRHETNIGQTNNINSCIERATGEYLLILHDDDEIDSDFIETCIKASTNAPDVGMIRTGMRWIDRNGIVLRETLNRVSGLPFEGFFLSWFAAKTPMHLCSTLFNTARLKEIGGLHSKHHRFDDVIAETRLAAKYQRVDIPDVKASYRHHPDQGIDKGEIRTWCEDSIILLDLICNLAAPSKAALLRREGIRFLIKHNYRIAAKVKSPIKRFDAYRAILKEFKCPPSQFISLILSRQFRAITTTIKKVLKQAPGSNFMITAFRKVVRE
jgi:glycosyltransferase involved in cell wall biosynthesis